MRSKTLLALAVPALLAACSGSEREPAPVDDNEVEMLDVTNEAANVAEPPAPTPTPTPDAVNTTAEAPVPPEEQVQDDADATGMTARVTREEPGAQEDATAPVEVK